MTTSVTRLIGVHRRICGILLLAVVSASCWFLIYMAWCLEPTVESNLGSPLTEVHSHDFIGFASTRTNPNYLSDLSTACVVDPAVTECIGIGLGGFLFLTLDHISVCQALGCSNITVFWRACDSICSEDPEVNSWEWYFEPVNPGIETRARKVLCIDFASVDEGRFQLTRKPPIPILSNNFSKGPNFGYLGFQEIRVLDDDKRRRVNQLLSTYVRPNTRITKKVDGFYDSHLAGYNLLGVHVRGTDHWMETADKKLPALNRWIRNAAVILESMPHPRKLFVASDNDEAIAEFVKHFGKENVTFIEAFRSTDYHGPAAHLLAEVEGVDPQVLGTQVLMDILLLAKCDHFLHAESSISALAAYFNPYMKSHYLEEEYKFQQVRPQKEDVETLDDNDDDDEQNFAQFVTCFDRNAPTSACPNGFKGIFVDAFEAWKFIN